MSDIAPTFQDLTPATATNVDVNAWYTAESIPGVPDTIAPYLAAHGFLVNSGAPYYVDGEFAGWLLNMNRYSFQHAVAIQILLNTMTFSFNEGRALNDKRYDDVVSGLQDLLANNQADIQSFITDKAIDASTGYITLLISTIDQLETDHTSFEADLNSYDSGDRDAELTRLKTIWQDAATTLEAEYTTLTAGLDIPGLISDVDTAVDALDAALTVFTDNNAALAATLLSDFNSHETTATAFLTGLGTTELARINELYDNRLSASDQSLVNRGFYASAIATQADVQIERERNEAIAELNDRLNREKFENQHRLYEQKYRMRLGALETDYRVFQGAAEVLSARLQHGQWASRIRHEIAQLSISAKLALLGVRERYYQFLLQSIQWQTDRRTLIYDRLFQTRLESMRVRASTGEYHANLIRYQLDQRTNLALALFGFVERREDDYPGLGDIASVVASLGDDN